MPSLVIDPARDLPVIPGQPPDLEKLPAGCAFASRCLHTFDACTTERPLLQAVGPDHARACHLPG